MISTDPMKVMEGGRFFRLSPIGNDHAGLYGPDADEKPEDDANIAQTRRLSEIACHAQIVARDFSRLPKVVEGGRFFSILSDWERQ